jgi:hypothetical protein
LRAKGLSLAGRQGVFARAFKNLNEDRPFQRNSHEAKDLPFSEFFVGFRPVAPIFGFFQRNDTRNVTRREQLPSLLI